MPDSMFDHARTRSRYRNHPSAIITTMAMTEEKVASGHAVSPCNWITATVPPMLTMRLCTQKCSATADPCESYVCVSAPACHQG